MKTSIQPRVDAGRLLDRLDELAEIGAIAGGGCSRLALTSEDGAGRDLVLTWMREVGLRIDVDGIGNVIGTWPADAHEPPVLMGSHIDTVRTGGRYDGNLGVLAGLAVIEAVIEAGVATDRPLAVGFFTDEEGSRFAPDMLGSLVYVGGMTVEDTLAVRDADGARVGDELDAIGYRGTAPSPGPVPHAFVELHIEQGPVLENDDVTIGAVTGVQGISWTEITIDGQSNHAGTTPMHLRHDAAYAAATITTFVRDLTWSIGHGQVGTVGRLDLHPDLVNVVPGRAVLTVDLRNTDADRLRLAESRLESFSAEVARKEGVTITSRPLARFAPVHFDRRVVDLVEDVAVERGLTVARLASGAGHDAQMFARVAPAGMIFVPSHRGISHNPAEHTEPADIEAGATVLLHVVLRLATDQATGGGSLRRVTRLVHVAGAQLGPIARDEPRVEVVDRLVALLRDAAGRGATLVAFPELALTTFFPRWWFDDDAELDAFYETEMPGPETKLLYEEAARLQVGFSLGFAELATDADGTRHRFNATVLVDATGHEVARYRKVHLPGHEDHEPWRPFQHLERAYFEPGPDGFATWPAFGGIVGLATCNDRRWPETYRVLGLAGVELVLIGYNTPIHYPPDPGQDHLAGHHNTLVMSAGAYQNGTWVVGVAKGGVEEGCELLAESQIISPAGVVVAHAATDGDEVIDAVCDLDLCAAYKDTLFDFDRYRMIEHYGPITAQRGARRPTSGEDP